jgi:hypothetical protein
MPFRIGFGVEAGRFAARAVSRRICFFRLNIYYIDI